MVKISQGIVKNWKLAYPSITEQKEIVHHIDRLVFGYDEGIELLKKKMKRYEELKQSVIDKVVMHGLDESTQLKNSEVDWIGDIPRTWKVKRIKDVSILYSGNSLNDGLKERFSANTIPNRPYIGTKDIDIMTCSANLKNGVYIPVSETKYKIAPKNSTLLCIEGGSAGKKMTFVERQVCFVNKLLCFSSFKNIDALFLHYFVRTSAFSLKFNSCLTGLKDNYWGVTGPQISRFEIPLPRLEEQQSIASYLSEKTDHIDRIINTIQYQVRHILELRKKMISDVVTGKIKVGSL